MTETETVNREAFRQVHELTTLFPELHFQRSWQASPGDAARLGRTTCGTTRCIAGWAVWLKARELGLITRKRDYVDSTVLGRVAEAMGLDNNYDTDYDDLHTAIGAAILGLDDEAAHSLFYDFNDPRARDRVKSYADTGEDLPYEKRIAYPGA